MTPGALILRLRQRFGHGIRVAYYRDIVRPRILWTPPILHTTDTSCEIHVLTSIKDWSDLIWGLKSFYRFSHRLYALTIHDDGSLGQNELLSLQIHFPDARIISRAQSDIHVEKILRDFPHSLEFRRQNPLALKVFDFATYLNSDRMLLLDSDILFFSNPTELIQRIENSNYNLNSLNKDWQHGYTLDPDIIQPRYGYSLERCINSGLGLIHKTSIDFRTIEDYLTIPGIFSHHHRIEQTLIALSSCRFGFEFLPVEYDVRVDKGTPREPCVHYTGPIRHLLYREGIKQLAHLGMLY